MSRIFFVLLVFLQLAACTTTNTGKAFQYLEDDLIVDALPYFEKGVKDGERISALMLAMIYTSDSHIPSDIKKAQQYFNEYLTMPSNIYDGTLSYHHPYVQAVILLEDDSTSNDVEANKLLRSSQYRSFSPVLVLLAKNYARGIGVQKNYSVSHKLYRKAIELNDDAYVTQGYTYLIATHNDDAYRGEIDYLGLMPDLDDVDENYEFTYHDVKAAALAREGRYSLAVEEQDIAIRKISRKLEIYPYYQNWLDDYIERKNNYLEKRPWNYVQDK